MTDETTAPADTKPLRKTKRIEAQLVTITHATGSAPAMLIDGDAPAKGSKFAAIIGNGLTYAGIVADTDDRDGKTLVTFRDGIAPLK